MTDIIILAAGKGTRMNSDLPKVLTPLNNKPMIHYLLDSIKKLELKTIPIIVASPENYDQIKESLKDYDLRFAIQDRQLGTGHAVLSAKDETSLQADKTLVLYGDHPFIKTESIDKFINMEVDTLNLLSVNLDNFSDWKKVFYHWGRLIRNGEGNLEKIVEFKDASDEVKEVTEVNPAIFNFNSKWLWDNISNLDNQNKQEEYYLTDLVNLAFKQGSNINTATIEPQEAMGVNSVKDLEVAKNINFNN